MMLKVLAVKGFTLIELVVTLSIIAVLSAVAVPSIVALQRDAQIARLQAMQAAMQSGVDLIYSKSTIAGRTDADDQIVIDGVTIRTSNGYPYAHWMLSMRYIVGLDDVAWFRNGNQECPAQWCGRGNQRSIAGGIAVAAPVVVGKIWPEGYRFVDACAVYLINRRDGNRPEVGLTTADC